MNMKMADDARFQLATAGPSGSLFFQCQNGHGDHRTVC